VPRYSGFYEFHSCLFYREVPPRELFAKIPSLPLTWWHSFSHYTRFTTIDEYRHKDWFENWKLPLFLPRRDGTPAILHSLYQTVNQSPGSAFYHFWIPPRVTLILDLPIYISLFFTSTWLHTSANRSSACWTLCLEQCFSTLFASQTTLCNKKILGNTKQNFIITQ